MAGTHLFFSESATFSRWTQSGTGRNQIPWAVLRYTDCRWMRKQNRIDCLAGVTSIGIDISRIMAEMALVAAFAAGYWHG